MKITVAIFFLFIFPLFRCLLDNWCVGCSTSDKRFVIIQGRGTVEQKQTLIAEIGGAIYVGKSSPGSLDQESPDSYVFKISFCVFPIAVNNVKLLGTIALLGDPVLLCNNVTIQL